MSESSKASTFPQDESPAPVDVQPPAHGAPEELAFHDNLDTYAFQRGTSFSAEEHIRLFQTYLRGCEEIRQLAAQAGQEAQEE